VRYFWLTIKHKWFVFLASFRTGAPLWRGVVHDWTKFLPCELLHYQRQFFGKADDPLGFMRAWLHHQNSHKHHWEYWIPRTGHNRCAPPYLDNEPMPMPESIVREMVADWLGAGRAYEGKWPCPRDWTWLKKARSKMRLHAETEKILDKILGELRGPPPVVVAADLLASFAEGVQRKYDEQEKRDKGGEFEGIEEDAIFDYTLLAVGSKTKEYGTEVVRCPKCGRSGILIRYQYDIKPGTNPVTCEHKTVDHVVVDFCDVTGLVPGDLWEGSTERRCAECSAFLPSDRLSLYCVGACEIKHNPTPAHLDWREEKLE